MVEISDGDELSVNGVLWRVHNPTAGSYKFDRVNYSGDCGFEAQLSGVVGKLSEDLVRKMISEYMEPTIADDDQS